MSKKDIQFFSPKFSLIFISMQTKNMSLRNGRTSLPSEFIHAMDMESPYLGTKASDIGSS